MMLDRMGFPRCSKFYWIAMLACISLLGFVDLGGAEEVGTKSDIHCNCDLKAIVQHLQQIPSMKKVLYAKKDTLAKQIALINQEILKEAMEASAKQGSKSQLAAKVAWNVFSASMDAGLDHLDFDVSKSKEQLIKGIDVLGFLGRSSKKNVAKAGKVYKAFRSLDSNTKKDSRLRKIANLYAKIDTVIKKIAQVNADKNKVWLKLLGADCRKVLKEKFPGNGIIKAHDLEAKLNEVGIPQYLSPNYTDRQIEEQFFEQGFLKTDINRIREVLKSTAEMRQPVYRYRVLARQINEFSRAVDQTCRVCGMLEQLRAISDLENRLQLVRDDWLQTNVKLLGHVTGAYHDITRMFATDAASKTWNTAHPVYQGVALFTSLITATSGVGTAMSIIDASFKSFQAANNYYYKAPVSEEIKKDIRFRLIFMEELKTSIEALTFVLQQVNRDKAGLIDKLIKLKEYSGPLRQDNNIPSLRG